MEGSYSRPTSWHRGWIQWRKHCQLLFRRQWHRWHWVWESGYVIFARQSECFEVQRLGTQNRQRNVTTRRKWRNWDKPFPGNRELGVRNNRQTWLGSAEIRSRFLRQYFVLQLREQSSKCHFFSSQLSRSILVSGLWNCYHFLQLIQNYECLKNSFSRDHLIRCFCWPRLYDRNRRARSWGGAHSGHFYGKVCKWDFQLKSSNLLFAN